jgi:hypothetical protein
MKYRNRRNYIFSVPPHAALKAQLVSSLQSFESCLFQIGLLRYQHAFTSCAFSIESALKIAMPEHERKDLMALLAEVKRQRTELSSFPDSGLDAVRKTRNRLVHEGFIPKDNRGSTTLLLGTALPFLFRCYQTFFRLSLPDGLLEEFASQF